MTDIYPKALAYIQSGGDPAMKKPTQAQQLTFYGLFKQIEKGKCTEKAPSRLKLTAYAKWDAWNKLGNISKEDAKKEYVATLTKMDPQWQTKADGASKIRSKL